MISRRNIRIKALQSLYILLNTSEEKSFAEGKKVLLANYNQALQLTIANFLLAKNICEYSIIDANLRSSKHLPSAADLIVSIKPAQNEVVIHLIENTSFAKAVEMHQLNGRWAENDFVKNLYNSIAQLEQYKTYVAEPIRNTKADIQFFKFILETISHNEDAQTMLSDLFIAFEDDKIASDAWIVANFNNIKNIDFTNLFSKEKSDFGLELVETFLEKQSYTKEIITPKLINWDVDRVAMMDIIILQMGVTEFLYFPTIPTKVTINEYIDLAKAYSTPQSGHFVNGVLDKIHKEFIAENKINKIERPSKKK